MITEPGLPTPSASVLSVESSSEPSSLSTSMDRSSFSSSNHITSSTLSSSSGTSFSSVSASTSVNNNFNLNAMSSLWKILDVKDLTQWLCTQLRIKKPTVKMEDRKHDVYVNNMISFLSAAAAPVLENCIKQCTVCDLETHLLHVVQFFMKKMTVPSKVTYTCVNI